MLQSTRINTLFEQIVREEYENKKQQQLLDSLHEQMDIANAANSAKSGADSVPKLPAGTGAGTLATVGGAMPAATPKFKSKLVTGSQVKDPNYKMKNPWSDTKAMAILKQLGAKPYPLTGFEDQFELVVPQGQSLTDRLRFSKDGQVYSGTYGGYLSWVVKGGDIELRVESVVNKLAGKMVVLGRLIPASGKFPVKFVPDANLEKEVNQSNKVPSAGLKKTNTQILDELQGILDWAGFVPVIGDAIDLLNAIWYFGRGKWFDGLFSIIAVIPLVGSFLKLGSKSLRKAAQKLGKIAGKFDNVDDLIRAGHPDDLAELWAHWVKKELIKPDELMKLHSGLLKFKSIFASKRFKGWVSGSLTIIPGGVLIEREAMEAIDDAVEFFEKQSRGTERALEAMGKGKKVAKTTGKTVSKNLVRKAGDKDASEILKKMINKGLFKGGYQAAEASKPGIKKLILAYFRAKRIPNLLKLNQTIRNNMMEKMMKGFLKKFGTDTKSYATLFKTTIGNKAMATEFIDILQRDPDIIAALNKALPGATKKDIAELVSGWFFDAAGKLLPTERLVGSLNVISRTSVKSFESMCELIIERAIDNGNYIFTTYMSDTARQLGNYFTRNTDGLAKTLGNEFLAQFFSARKWADIAMSELEDMTEWTHTLIDPSSYYAPGTIGALPSVDTDNPLNTSWYNPMGMIAKIAKGMQFIWNNSSDDEKNGWVFETVFQPTMEELRTSKILTTPAGQLLKRSIQNHVSTAEVALSKTMGTSTLGKSLAKTKGYDPSKIDRGSNTIFQPDQK